MMMSEKSLFVAFICFQMFYEKCIPGKVTHGKMPPGKVPTGKLPPGSLRPKKNSPRKLSPGKLPLPRALWKNSPVMEYLDGENFINFNFRQF